MRANDTELRRRRLAWPLTLHAGKWLFRWLRRRAPVKIKRIVFFKFGALGDVLLTTPLIRAMREKFPRAQLTYLTAQGSHQAVAGHPDLDRLLTFADQRRLIPRLNALVRLVRKVRREKFDLVFVLDRAWQANVLGRAMGRFTVGFDRLGEGFALDASVPYGYEPHEGAPHDSDTYLALGQIIGTTMQQRQLHLTVTDEDTRHARARLMPLGTDSQPIIALCPGGARNQFQPMPERRWPIRHYQALAQQLTQAGYKIIIVGDQHDRADGQKIEATVPANHVINFCGETSLAQAAALLNQCAAVIVADTALLHVAATTSTPIIALFGPTNPRRKQPLGSKHRSIWKGVACPRCGQRVCHWETIAPHPETAAAMHAISVTEVAAAVAQVA